MGAHVLQLRCLPGLQSHVTAVLQTLVVLEKFTSVRAVEMKASVSSWQLVGCLPEVIGFSNMAASFIKACKPRRQESGSETEITIVL